MSESSCDDDEPSFVPGDPGSIALRFLLCCCIVVAFDNVIDSVLFGCTATISNRRMAACHTNVSNVKSILVSVSVPVVIDAVVTESNTDDVNGVGGCRRFRPPFFFFGKTGTVGMMIGVTFLDSSTGRVNAVVIRGGGTRGGIISGAS